MATNEQYYHDLAYARRQQKEVNQVSQLANQTIKPSSGLIYVLLFSLSIIGDILDFADFTGIGALVSFIVDLFIGVILFLLGRVVAKRISSMNDLHDGVFEHIQNIEKKIIAYRNTYSQILRTSRKIGFLRKPVRKLAMRLSRLRKSIGKNPMTRTVYAILADLVPFLDLVPWRTINIYLMRRDELRAFKDSQEIIPEYMAAKADEIEAANDLQEAEIAEQTT